MNRYWFRIIGGVLLLPLLPLAATLLVVGLLRFNNVCFGWIGIDLPTDMNVMAMVFQLIFLGVSILLLSLFREKITTWAERKHRLRVQSQVDEINNRPRAQ